MFTAAETHTEIIDAHLQHYLALLDEYTILRNTLHILQTNVFQHLARANFSAERGIRYYGKDYYDERMQAVRRVRILSSSRNETTDSDFPASGAICGKGRTIRAPAFEVGGNPHAPPASSQPAADEAGSGKGDGMVEGDDVRKQSSENGSRDAGHDDEEGKKTQPTFKEDTGRSQPGNKEKQQSPPTDPLRWFGVLTPMPLRLAQAQAIKAVEEVIPKLATISAEMAAVELEVRRARKRRAKAEKIEGERAVDLQSDGNRTRA